MIWLNGDPYHIASKCGHYTVSKAIVEGTPRYTAWYVRGKDVQPKSLGVGSTAGIAKVMCEDHDRAAPHKGG